MLRSVPTLQPLPPVVSGNLADKSASGPLLSFAGPLVGAHALVIAEHGLDLMCGLLQQGCTAATTMRPSERADHEEYDLVLAPCVTLPASVGALTHQAHRALRPGGRFAAFVPTSLHGAGRETTRSLLGSLSAAGFTSVEIRLVRDGVLVRGTVSADAAYTSAPVVLRCRV